VSRVLTLVPDLMFGSRIKALLEADGHEVSMALGEADARDRAGGADVLVVDLNADGVDGPELIGSLGGSPRTLGVYAHTDVDLRRRAEEAGFDLVVPRSRMVREGAALVARLATSA
jgi:DNA-binding response OmpR family regulator